MGDSLSYLHNLLTLPSRALLVSGFEDVDISRVLAR